jgi:hypothetical protein
MGIILWGHLLLKFRENEKKLEKTYKISQIFQIFHKCEKMRGEICC